MPSFLVYQQFDELGCLHLLTCLHKALAPAGQTFDSTLTLDMQIFGQNLTTFGTDQQTIIKQGVATFLNSGVTATQIVLTVRNQIAGVSSMSDIATCYCFVPACVTASQ